MLIGIMSLLILGIITLLVERNTRAHEADAKIQLLLQEIADQQKDLQIYEKVLIEKRTHFKEFVQAARSTTSSIHAGDSTNPATFLGTRLLRFGPDSCIVSGAPMLLD